MTYHSLAKIFEDKEVALQYFIDKGLFSTKKCWSCKSTMSVNTKKALFICKKNSVEKVFLSTRIRFLVRVEFLLTLFVGFVICILIKCL